MTQENIPLQLGEEIKPIRGYEGLYSITSFGRVWSHEKLRKFGKNTRMFKGKFLMGFMNNSGYWCVKLSKGGNLIHFLIHVLVAIHYIPNPQNFPEVNHKDTDKLNNYKDNLEWCTDQENKNHAIFNGLYRRRNKKYSKYDGVSLDTRISRRFKPWRVFLRNIKMIHVGYFKTEIEAAQAYNKYVVEHKLNRLLNKIEDCGDNMKIDC